jgi:hypothetical protein
MLRDFRLRRRDSAADLEIPAVGQGQKIGERPGNDSEPVLGKPQIADTLGLRRLTV